MARFPTHTTYEDSGGRTAPPRTSTIAELIHHQQVLVSNPPQQLRRPLPLHNPQDSASTTQLTSRTLQLHILCFLPLRRAPRSLRHWHEPTSQPIRRSPLLLHQRFRHRARRWGTGALSTLEWRERLERIVDQACRVRVGGYFPLVVNGVLAIPTDENDEMGR